MPSKGFYRAKLTLFDVHKFASRLLPLGDVQKWFRHEYAPIWNVLCKWSSLRNANLYGQDVAMKAHLLGYEGNSVCLDLAGRKGIMDVTKIPIPESTLAPDTMEQLAAIAYLAPDSEINVVDWFKYWLPQVLYFHATAAAAYGADLATGMDKVGLLKSDYWRVGYH